MHFVIKTKVKGNYKDVMSQFNKDLFLALAPPFPKMELLEFTGSKKGDRVHIRFLPPFSAEWISDITDDGCDKQEIWFVDEGSVLPFPLKYWRHRHIVRKSEDGHSIIIDDITYRGSNKLVSIILFIPLYIGFVQRRPVYRRYFK